MSSRWLDPDQLARDELRKLAKAQQRLLPKEAPRIAGFDVHLAFRPAFIATGDYYDFFLRPDGRFALFIGDGSGHGPSACMLMAMMRAMLHTHPDLHRDAGGTLALTSKMFEQLIPSDMFMTGLYLIFDDEKGEVEWAAAGQHPPLRLKANGSLPPVDLDLGDIPLGIHCDSEYRYQSVNCRLEPGERLLLFTDGLYESQNRFGEKLGRCRLDSYLKETRPIPLKEMVDGLVTMAASYIEGADFEDDFTIIGLERRPDLR